MDYEKWGSWPTLPTGGSPTWEEQVSLLRNEYFPRRRVYLYGVDGDMDFSGTVDIDDVDDFVLGLSDPAAYEAIYGVKPSLRGDTNFDITLDFDDIGAFVGLVNGGTHHSGLVPAAQVGCRRSSSARWISIRSQATRTRSTSS